MGGLWSSSPPRMYFMAKLSIHLMVEPKYCGPGYHRHVEKTLREKFDATLIERVGWVVAVKSAGNAVFIGSAKCQDGTGMLLVPVGFEALMYKPYKNEVLDCQVTEVVQVGVFAEAGPLTVFVSKDNMKKGWSYQGSDDEPLFTSEDNAEVIKKSTTIRVKLLGTKEEENRLFAVATLNEALLGPRIAQRDRVFDERIR